MKLSWLATTSAALLLEATPVFSHSQNAYTAEGRQYEKRDDEEYNEVPHLPDDCSDIRIFNARGSDEPYPGRGGTMLGILCSLFEPTGVSCDYEDIVYPANISWSGIYCESCNAGAYAGQAQMTDYVQRCPDSRLVLIGYSQGADVVGNILGGGGGPIFGCEQAWNPPLDRSTAPGSSIVAVATMGDPRYTARQPYNLGLGATFNGTAPRQGEQLAALNDYEDVIAMWCNHGDPVCATGSEPENITAHWSYYDEFGWVASQWVRATALGWTDEQLDLNLDGHNESVVLVGSSSSNGSDDGSGGDENGAVSLRCVPNSGPRVLIGLVTLITAGLFTIS